MDPKLMAGLDKVLDDVIEVLEESGWDDEAAWYQDLRRTILAQPPDSPEFMELLIELEGSFLGLGSFMDIPLDQQGAEILDEVSRLAAIDTHHQRLGLVSCASGIICEIKKSALTGAE
jgi:hypothetical protein